MSDFRHLQRQCEHEAAMSTTPGAREALQEMATEYRHRAEYEERQQLEPNRRPQH